MKNKITFVTILLVCAIATTFALSVAHAQSKGLSWTNRDRVLRAFDVDTAQSLEALEQTVADFCGNDESKIAEFVVALETNLFPPKTGAARVQALDEIKERVERDLGADSPILTTISAEKKSVAKALEDAAAKKTEVEEKSAEN